MINIRPFVFISIILICIPVVMKADNQEDFGYFMKRSEYWRNTWDPSIRYFRARAADGTWLDFPDNPVYQLTTPIFDEVSIRLDPKIYSGKTFALKANKLSKENYYIQSAMLNGKPLNRSWIKHEEIAKDGELMYEMGPNPNKSWGIE